MNVTSNVDPALFRVHAFITVVDSALDDGRQIA
jgi:hypothetical protein